MCAVRKRGRVPLRLTLRSLIKGTANLDMIPLFPVEIEPSQKLQHPTATLNEDLCLSTRRTGYLPTNDDIDAHG